jgi:molybdenum cofactor cytidylyltransferase
MRNVAAIVLAAGKASRYRAADPEAATKVVALYKGEPMVRRAACAALNAGVAPVVVVTGCEPQAVRDALAGVDVTFAHNDEYESGIASSVNAGIAALPETTEAAFVMLGDMPLVDAKLLQSLDAARLAAGSADAVLPVHGGQRGNPVLMGRSLFAAAMALTGDEGARKLLRDPSLTIVEVAAGEGVAVDIDTPEALRSAEARE